jgi:polyferredoxin
MGSLLTTYIFILIIPFLLWITGSHYFLFFTNNNETYTRTVNSSFHLYLYLASVGRIPLGTGSMVPISVSRFASNACFGSGSDGRPAESVGACSCSVHKKIMYPS